MKINYNSRPLIDNSINVAGNFIVSLKNGKTRTQNKVYQVIRNPKTQALDKNFMYYISDKNVPVKIGLKANNTFRLATKSEIDNFKNHTNEDQI